MNGATDVAAVAEGDDESGNEGIGEFVGLTEEGICGGEERVGEQEVGDGDVAIGGVGIVIRVGVWI